MRKTVLRFLEWMQRCPAPSDHKYHTAMQASGEILQRMSEGSNHPVNAMVADLIKNRHNAPYITTVYEALQEVNAPLKQRADQGR